MAGIYTYKREIAMLCCGGALLSVFVKRRHLQCYFLSIIDETIGVILSGPRLKGAVSVLVAGLLEEAAAQEAIACAVTGVLRDRNLKEEISLVVNAVLSEKHIEARIASTVRGVLHDEVVEKKIAEVVCGCLTNETVADGIVGAMKGTGLNVLNGASDLVIDKVLPTWVSSLARRSSPSDSLCQEVPIEASPSDDSDEGRDTHPLEIWPMSR